MTARIFTLACLIAAEPLFAEWTVRFAEKHVCTIHFQGGSLFIPVWDTQRTYFYRSDDTGATWDSLGGGMWIFILQIQNIGDTLFASSHWSCLHEGCYGPAVFRSYARGSAPWQAIYESYQGVYRLVAHNGILFMQDNDEIYKSEDAGESWTRFWTAPSSLGLTSLDGVLYSNGLYESNYNGAKWKSIRGNLFSTYVYAIEKNDAFLFACKDSVFRSADSGHTWERINSGLPLGRGHRYYYLAAEDNYVAVANSDSAYLSANNGEHWTNISQGLSFRTIYGLLIKDDFLFVGSNKGLWRSHVSYLVSVKENGNNSEPASYRLEQNYPNPFNPSTTIRYSLPHAARISLTIYGVQGMKIRTLIDSFQGAGEHAWVWDGKDDQSNRVASGVYFCLLRANGLKLQRKMMLVQ